VPRKADHAARRRQITDAVCRLTVKGGLPAATFREIAAEAGVSVRLVQYYFGTKGDLMLATQRRVAERSAERLRAHVQASDGTPRGRLRALLHSFIPTDEESREHMLVFIALAAAALVDPVLARPETADVPAGMATAIRDLLEQARPRAGVQTRHEAMLLLSAVPGLAQGVLDGSLTADQAFSVLDYALDRALLRS
jgi:TetR/AcrR family transcriptional regulator, transcriptional repressor of bet genes